MSIPVRLIQVYAVPYAYAPNGEPLYVEYSSLSLSSARKRRALEPSITNANNNNNTHIAINANPKRKSRLVWTHSLHQSFLNAVHTLGVDIAVPKQIMKIMNVHSLTRENVASHLQKYRAALKRDQQRNGNINTDQAGQAQVTNINIDTAQNGNHNNNKKEIARNSNIHPPSLRISKFPLNLVLNNNSPNNSPNNSNNHVRNLRHYQANNIQHPRIPETHPTSNPLVQRLASPGRPVSAPTTNIVQPPANAITSSLSISTTSIRTCSSPPPLSTTNVQPPSIRPTSSLPIPPPPISISVSTNRSLSISPARTIIRNSSSVPAPSIRTLPIPPPPVVSNLQAYTPPPMTSSLPPIRSLSFRSPV